MRNMHKKTADRPFAGRAPVETRALVNDVQDRCTRLQAHLDAALARVANPGRAASQPAWEYQPVLERLKASLGVSQDVIFRPFQTPDHRSVTVIYIAGLVNEQELGEWAIGPLLNVAIPPDLPSLDKALGQLLKAPALTAVQTAEQAAHAVLAGSAVVMVDGFGEGAALPVQGAEQRPVGKTSVENVLRGPLDAFTEALDVNTALIRLRVQDPCCQVEYHTVGQATQTRVALLAVQGRVDPDILDRVRYMVDHVSMDIVTDSGELVQHMAPGWLHIWPIAVATERPDRVVQALYDGRVVLVVDTSPFAVILPSLYVDFYRAMEDLYLPWVPSTFIRLLRLFSDHAAALLPALYVCLASYNPAILTPPFMQALASTRSMVPYSPLVEALLVLILTDILIEATVRSPKVVGNAVPIVGGIIIGDVLAKTHLAGSVMLVAGALAALSQFTAAEPSIQVVERANKYWFLVWAGVLGFYGLMIATAVELLYLATLDSAGTPYFSPVAPFKLREALNSKFVLPPQWRPKKATLANQR